MHEHGTNLPNPLSGRHLLSALALAAALMGPLPALAEEAPAGWYRSWLWPGEYPPGFTLSRDIETSIRAEPRLETARDIACTLRRGATYHPWNKARVAGDRLRFLALNRIQPWRVTKPVTVDLVEETGDGRRSERRFDVGETWDYLMPHAEGLFLMRSGDRTYQTGQALVQASTALAPARGDDLVLWLEVTCAEGRGWLLLGDVAGQAGVESPNITGYGAAADR